MRIDTRKKTTKKTPAEQVTTDAIKEESRFSNRIRSVRSSNGMKLTQFIKPMLANLHDQTFDDKEWIFEIKWDGYRAVAEIGKGVRLYSRNGLSFLQLYPQVAEELKKIKTHAVLDGEIVVLNKSNKPDFQSLQQYDPRQRLPLLYYVFDCLEYDGKSLMHLPLIERKKFAAKVIPENSIIKYSDHVHETGKEFFSKAVEMDLEGIIAKRANSIYLPGKRTRDWLKIKNHNTQEAIIAGYTAPRGGRKYFGALILALMVNGKLTYIGHTGTGFTEDLLKNVYGKLQPLKRASSPFDRKIAVNSTVTWIEPVLVCNIKYTEITADGILRHPVFLGLRVDKSAAETTTLDTAVKTHPTGKKSAEEKKETTSSKSKIETKVNGHTLTLTNTNKIYWPEEKITKGNVIDYYNSIHRYIIPYLKDRPQSLKRNPNGIKDSGFFHKDAGGAALDWVQSIKIKSERANKKIDYILCNDRATLLYLNNLGCIEFNPWNSRQGKLDYPDYMVLDIDPSDESDFEAVIDTALVIKSILDKAGAPSYCKTSGATGIHIYVPLKAMYTFDQIRAFAEIVAKLTEEQLPNTTTTERSLDKRQGRIYLDYLQNKRGQTLASVYSLRPKPGATISTPLHWKEVKQGLHPSQFNIFNIGARLEKTGDLFTGVLKEKINLNKCLKNLGA